jgi:hypothetical protein
MIGEILFYQKRILIGADQARIQRVQLASVHPADKRSPNIAGMESISASAVCGSLLNTFYAVTSEFFLGEDQHRARLRCATSPLQNAVGHERQIIDPSGERSLP